MDDQKINNQTAEQKQQEDNDLEKVCSKCQTPAAEKSEHSAGHLHDRHYKEKFLRAMADFENFKHRTEKDKANWSLDAQAEIIKKFLPLFDDIERAAQSVPTVDQGSAAQAWVDGVVKICHNNLALLHKLGVQEVRHDGQFDPEIHEALCQVPTAEVASGSIVEVLRRGYTFSGILVRHAQVSVAE
jgi:molecular chaperone GrpE